MRRVVWKFPLRVGRYERVPAGPGKVVLAEIDLSSGAPAVWIEQEAGQVPAPPFGEMGNVAFTEPSSRTFIVIRTGAEVDEDWTHVGSMRDRTFIWHVYERAAS